jgi:hypothetical protein
MKICTKQDENKEIDAYRTVHLYNKQLYFGDTVILVRIVSK